jgi:hypothetical protein
MLKPVISTSAAFLLQTPQVQSFPVVAFLAEVLSITSPWTVKKKEASSRIPMSAAQDKQQQHD